jgi:hypothetical protein
MSKTVSTTLFFLAIIVVAGLISLSLATYGLYQRIEQIENKPSAGQKVVVIESQNSDGSTGGVDLAGLIEDEVVKQIAGLPTAEPITVVGQTHGSAPTSIPVPTQAPVVQKSTSFIPLDGTKTTTSTDWETIEDSAVWIDLINDYGSGATVTWSASLKVAHGNGQAYARIWDDTNKIAVGGSELLTTNNVSFETKESGGLPLWAGRNLYKVQIKSLNGFEVTYSGGKMRVSH